MRYYRANQAVMDKASMLYNRFKNAYLLGEGEEVVSTAFLRSLMEEKEREEAQRVERWKERKRKEDVLPEVKRRIGQVEETRKTSGGDGEREETVMEGTAAGVEEDKAGGKEMIGVIPL